MKPELRVKKGLESEEREREESEKQQRRGFGWIRAVAEVRGQRGQRGQMTVVIPHPAQGIKILGFDTGRPQQVRAPPPQELPEALLPP
uniref:Uncharacterized protein n=1 Tax=Gasterosteus aculeatus TaxID=69293 RepID=G3PZB7_GASAC